MLEVGLQCAGSMLLGVQIKSTPYIVSGGPLNSTHSLKIRM